MPSLFDVSDIERSVTVSTDKVVQIIESGLRKLNEYGVHVPDAIAKERAVSITTVLIMEELIRL